MKKIMVYISICAVLIFKLPLVCGAAGTNYTDLSSVYAFPVPYLPGSGHSKITFINLSSEATIKIYTLTGELVKTLNESDGDQVHDWYPVENDEGREVASGIYLYFVYNNEEIKIGKLIISR